MLQLRLTIKNPVSFNMLKKISKCYNYDINNNNKNNNNNNNNIIFELITILYNNIFIYIIIIQPHTHTHIHKNTFHTHWNNKEVLKRKLIKQIWSLLTVYCLFNKHTYTHTHTHTHKKYQTYEAMNAWDFGFATKGRFKFYHRFIYPFNCFKQATLCLIYILWATINNSINTNKMITTLLFLLLFLVGHERRHIL